MFRWILLFACLLAAVTGLALGVMNPDPVIVELPGATFELPLGSLLVAVFALGTAAGFVVFFILFHLPSRLHRRRSTSDSKDMRVSSRDA